MNGVIDEIRVYNRALSASEIQTDMNTPINGTPPPPDAVPPGPNLVSNPGFESGATGWSFPAGSAIDTSTAPHGGLRSARIARTANGTTSIRNNPRVSVSANTLYRAEVWVKRSGVINGQGARVQVQWFNSAGTSLGSRIISSNLFGTSNWAQISSAVSSPAAAASARFLLQLSNAIGTAWFDDAELFTAPGGGFGAPSLLLSNDSVRLAEPEPDTDDPAPAARNSAALNLGRVRVYPNPYRPGSGGDYDAPGIIFDGLTSDARITIYTIMGEKAAALEINGGNGKLLWDTRNSGGELVPSGVYIYRVTNPQGESITGRLAVVR